MADSSFDVVSEVDFQEVRNAATQAEKEIATRYDLKRVNAKLRIEGEALELEAADDFTIGQAREVLESKLVKRGVHLKSPAQGRRLAGEWRAGAPRSSTSAGIPIETARKSSRYKRAKLKGRRRSRATPSRRRQAATPAECDRPAHGDGPRRAAHLHQLPVAAVGAVGAPVRGWSRRSAFLSGDHQDLTDRDRGGLRCHGRRPAVGIDQPTLHEGEVRGLSPFHSPRRASSRSARGAQLLDVVPHAGRRAVEGGLSTKCGPPASGRRAQARPTYTS